MSWKTFLICQKSKTFSAAFICLFLNIYFFPSYIMWCITQVFLFVICYWPLTQQWLLFTLETKVPFIVNVKFDFMLFYLAFCLMLFWNFLWPYYKFLLLTLLWLKFSYPPSTSHNRKRIGLFGRQKNWSLFKRQLPISR